MYDFRVTPPPRYCVASYGAQLWGLFLPLSAFLSWYSPLSSRRAPRDPPFPVSMVTGVVLVQVLFRLPCCRGTVWPEPLSLLGDTTSQQISWSPGSYNSLPLFVTFPGPFLFLDFCFLRQGLTTQMYYLELVAILLFQLPKNVRYRREPSCLT